MREIDGRAVEIGPFMEGLEQACRCRRSGGTSVVGKSHCAGVVWLDDEVSKRIGKVGGNVHGPTVSQEVGVVVVVGCEWGCVLFVL